MALDNTSEVISENQGYAGRLFLGTVVEDQDPTGTGRFKARVPGLFEDGELPWIGRIRESAFGMGPNYGTFGTPHIGSSVVIELQNGDAAYPRCVGFYPRASDVPEVFRNGRVWGYRDPSGTQLVVNPDTKTYEFTHASGTTYTINPDGSLTADVKGFVNITINGNLTASVTGTSVIQSGSSSTVIAPSVILDSPQTTATGNLTVEGLLTALSGVMIEGDNGTGAAGTIRGNINHSDGTLRSNGIGVHTHNHSGTGPPVAGS